LFPQQLQKKLNKANRLYQQLDGGLKVISSSSSLPKAKRKIKTIQLIAHESQTSFSLSIISLSLTKSFRNTKTIVDVDK
jgi:hypothetical protein